jgi:hypothetical protein
MLESVLRLLFSSKDLSRVKGYCTRQWGKMLANRVALQVGGEVRGAGDVCVCGGGGAILRLGAPDQPSAPPI